MTSTYTLTEAQIDAWFDRLTARHDAIGARLEEDMAQARRLSDTLALALETCYQPACLSGCTRDHR